MTQSRRHPNVVNVSEVDSRTVEKGTRFGATMKSLGHATGSKGIGCTWYEIPPGRTAFPFHYHCANEESLYVVEGQALLRIGKDTLTLGPGDYVTFPIGPDSAHQVQNNGTTPLRYLCMSTMRTAEVVGYPDSKKVGVIGAASREDIVKGAHWVRLLAFESSAVDYYDGEDVG